jgi:hypothetical protein
VVRRAWSLSSAAGAATAAAFIADQVKLSRRASTLGGRLAAVVARAHRSDRVRAPRTVIGQMASRLPRLWENPPCPSSGAGLQIGSLEMIPGYGEFPDWRRT